MSQPMFRINFKGHLAMSGIESSWAPRELMNPNVQNAWTTCNHPGNNFGLGFRIS
jgi:hypothetical protein